MVDLHAHIKTLYYILYLPTGELVNNPLLGDKWGFKVRSVAIDVIKNIIDQNYLYHTNLRLKNPAILFPTNPNLFEVIELDRTSYELVY